MSESRRAGGRSPLRSWLRVEPLEERLTPAGATLPAFVEGQVLFGVANGADAATVIRSMSSSGLVASGGVEALGFGVYKAKLAAGVTAAQATAALGGTSGVSYVTRDDIQYPQSLPNDARIPEMWAVQNTGQGSGTPGADIRLSGAWDINTGSGQTVVAVLDSGTLLTHPDLAANIWRNPGEVAGDGIDNDGDGYVDDVNGYDFGDNDPDPSTDLQYSPGNVDHGTHVGGTIAAVGNNGIGVTGVMQKARMIALKIGTGAGAGASTSAEVQAMNFAATHGARVMNLSYGSASPPRPAFVAAVQGLQAYGAILVASAGNSANDNDANPNSNSFLLPNYVSVAATDWRDQLSSFSNYGAVNVTIGAPGGDQSRYGANESGILSTVPAGYDFYQGTSMAAPQVTGALGLLFDTAPDLSYAEAIQILKETADPVPGLAGKVSTGARLNVQKMLERVAAIYATGADAGGGPAVSVFTPGGTLKASFFAYQPGYTGGVRVATADVTGDRRPDIITATGPGGAPHVKVFDGKTFQEIYSFFAYDPGFRGGVYVAAGDLDGDGRAEIVTGAGEGGASHVKAFKLGAAGRVTTVDSFFAYDPGFTGGVRVSAADFNGDGRKEIVTAAGPGGGPHVKAFDARDLTVVAQAMAGDPADRRGLFVSAGVIDSSGVPRFIVGSGSGTAEVGVYDGLTGGQIKRFVAPEFESLIADQSTGTLTTGGTGGLIPGTGGAAVTTTNTIPLPLGTGVIPAGGSPSAITNPAAKQSPPANQAAGGARVASLDVNRDGYSDFVIGVGPAEQGQVIVLSGKDDSLLRSFFPFTSGFAGGIFVAGA